MQGGSIECGGKVRSVTTVFFATLVLRTVYPYIQNRSNTQSLVYGEQGWPAVRELTSHQCVLGFIPAHNSNSVRVVGP